MNTSWKEFQSGGEKLGSLHWGRSYPGGFLEEGLQRPRAALPGFWPCLLSRDPRAPHPAQTPQRGGGGGTTWSIFTAVVLASVGRLDRSR